MYNLCVCVLQALPGVALRSLYLLSSVFMFLLPEIYKSLNFITHIIFITLSANPGSLSVIFYPNIPVYLLFFLYNAYQYLKHFLKLLIAIPFPLLCNVHMNFILKSHTPKMKNTVWR